ncbi:MAG: hypothetical protein IKO22_07425 [Oscillospiraceae bacterium]|nr:hypothetical protein [Oscillospiraceae bacterium]
MKQDDSRVKPTGFFVNGSEHIFLPKEKNFAFIPKLTGKTGEKAVLRADICAGG